MLQFALAPPLLFALGVRIFINFITPGHVPSTADHLLIGIWQGVLVHYTLRYFGSFVFPVGAAIAGKLLYDFATTQDPTKCACALLGVALGVLFTDLLAQLFEDGRINERTSQPTAPTTQRAVPPEPSKRIRLVSFEHDKNRERRRAAREKGKGRERDRVREEEEAAAAVERANARALAASPAPTYAHSIDTAITLDSLPSSIDPDNRLSPAEREVAMLRARASLADSERRRFKEERKWALSQGNAARASQLEWQVKRYATLVKSFNREADDKLIEASRSQIFKASKAAAPPFSSVAQPNPVQVAHTQPAPHVQTYMVPAPQGVAIGQPQAGSSHGVPLVSVTVGGKPRSRKRSAGASALKPAIYVHNRE
ncbi:hypothetical protein BDY19DRAFT_903029 [Irpex rosettiformis]|uniref:Uncharacterized protein n=1 Tax=Irpex rosettiformis TaxID=378272 RepID=A0ACB8UG59_9APHY|nr:hypothetical protein BDY19DRAFT_903029 [Irpex rosettiformis]